MTSLSEAGKAYRDAENQKKKALIALKQCVIKAYTDGLSVTEISRKSGLSRQTVYDTLRK